MTLWVTQTSGEGTVGVQNTVYDGNGDAVGQLARLCLQGTVTRSRPASQPGAGHGPGAIHIDPSDVPDGWGDLPPGIPPAQQ